MKKVILASASPRRKELLEKIGLTFTVEPSNSEECIDASLGPQELVKSLSLEKAASVAHNHQNALVIAADTLVVFQRKIVGKPHSEAEARQILEMLQGKQHLVTTGFTIIDTENDKVQSQSVDTIVYLNRLTPDEILAYVRSGEPLDKAGGYAIQGLGSVIVNRIEGDYYNVMGLPLSALVESLKEFGIHVL